MLAARDAERGALGGLVALAAGEGEPQALSVEGEALAVDTDNLRAAKRAGVAEQEQGAIAQPGGVAAAGRDQSADLRRG